LNAGFPTSETTDTVPLAAVRDEGHRALGVDGHAARVDAHAHLGEQRLGVLLLLPYLEDGQRVRLRFTTRRRLSFLASATVLERVGVRDLPFATPPPGAHSASATIATMEALISLSFSPGSLPGFPDPYAPRMPAVSLTSRTIRIQTVCVSRKSSTSRRAYMKEGA
jgi:hypothetical protein